MLQLIFEQKGLEPYFQRMLSADSNARLRVAMTAICTSGAYKDVSGRIGLLVKQRGGLSNRKYTSLAHILNTELAELLFCGGEQTNPKLGRTVREKNGGLTQLLALEQSGGILCSDRFPVPS
jgi:hypothetical protein